MKSAWLIVALALATAAAPPPRPLPPPPSSPPSSPITASGSPSCALHVFPTTEIVDSSPDYMAAGGFSVIGALVGGAYSGVQASGSGKLKAGALSQMKILFSADTQVAELRRIDVISLLKLPADTQIVPEAALPAPFGDKPDEPAEADKYARFWAAMKQGTPLAPPTSACHRELYVAAIRISKGLGSLQFSTSFIYRTFDAGQHETHAFDGESAVPLQNYVSLKTAPSADALNAAFVEAFSANFTRWVARRVKL